MEREIVSHVVFLDRKHFCFVFSNGIKLASHVCTNNLTNSADGQSLEEHLDHNYQHTQAPGEILFI